MDRINMKRNKIPLVYPQQLERDLILWTWGLGPEDIIFTPKAVNMLFESSLGLAESFDFSIPLIQGENIRIKVARIAVAFAARFFSANKEGSKLIVKRQHVTIAATFLHRIYKRRSSGYFALSQLRQTSKEEIKNIAALEHYFTSFRHDQKLLCRCFLQSNMFSSQDISEALSQDTAMSNEIISNLLSWRCVEKRGRFYVKTSMFAQWLKDRVQGKRRRGSDASQALEGDLQ